MNDKHLANISQKIATKNSLITTRGKKELKKYLN